MARLRARQKNRVVKPTPWADERREKRSVRVMLRPAERVFTTIVWRSGMESMALGM